MIRTAVLSFFVALLPLASAQTLLASTLPACAQTCTLWQNAANGCLPSGGAPVSNQATYTSCFCQSALLTGVRTSNANQCPTQCSNADFAAIVTWYNTQICPVNGAAAAPSPTTTLSTSTTTTLSSTSSSTSGLSPEDDGEDASTTTGAGWFNAHRNWVAFIIVLAVALIALAVGGTWFHKRHRRRREAAENLGPRPDISTWGPTQHSVHDLSSTLNSTPVNTATPPPAMTEKGKGKERAETGGVRDVEMRAGGPKLSEKLRRPSKLKNEA